MNRRTLSSYFPEPRFQSRFVAVLMSVAFFQLVITYSFVGYFVSQNYDLLVRYAGLEPEILKILKSEFKWMIFLMGIVGTAFLITVGLIGVVFSHRVAGPIYALKRTIKDIASGKNVQLKFRKYDEFLEVADAFNNLISQLKKRNAA